MITRDNYEEFFLLYTDNELSAAERHAVERFVDDHPDLREEWEALLQCRLSPEPHLTFPGRKALLKPESEVSNHTDDLLSYIDGELDDKNTARIEAMLRQDSLVEKEFIALRQTVSHPDPAIIFPEKDRLYRTEKNRRVIPLPWLRAGIAAAVAGTIALLLLLPARRRSDQPALSIAVRQDSPAGTNKSIPTVTLPTVAALHSIEAQPTTHRDQRAKQIVERREPQQPQDVAVDNNQDGSPAATLSKIDPAAEIHDTDPVTTAAIGSTPPTDDLAANIHLAVQNGIPKEQSSFATQALQEEAGDQRNRYFTSDESAAPGRAALRGIFRKVKRAFGKTAERDSDGNRQVLVGAFQVSLD
jgi:anti-sigma factor RsiW